MITEEDLFNISQELNLAAVKDDLKRALQGVTSAIHYLHETSRYESDMLDNTLDDLMTIKHNLKGLIDD